MQNPLETQMRQAASKAFASNKLMGGGHPMRYIGRTFEIVGSIAVILGILLAPVFFVLSNWRVPNPAGPFLVACSAVPAGMLLMIAGEQILKPFRSRREPSHTR